MSYEPKPSLPRHIHSPVDHYDVDVETGTITYHIVKTNGDRIRSMCDEDLALFLEPNIYGEEERHENCTVQILRNSQTGAVSFGWWENDG